MEFKEISGKTTLTRNFQTGSARILKPFYIGNCLITQIITIGAGIHAGDELEIEVNVGKDCHVILLNQSATKILKSENDEISMQFYNIYIDDNAILEYYPGINIPFEGSRFLQKINVYLSSSANFGFFEMWSMGRIERGEYLSFNCINNNLKIFKQSIPIYIENFSISQHTAKHIGIIGRFKYMISGVWTFLNLGENIEEHEDFILIYGTNHRGLAFIKGLSNSNFILAKRVIDLIDSWRNEKYLQSIPWYTMSSAFL
ncbi:Urease accessory protein UreD [Thermocrinis albus DSM 14484]|uniref:Urease accessory protein UreD n=2 Tax=Thermocrinis TaxID=75905 RepID=D3SQC2_THEAH|nr:Urease accessory protein UreD [Thermocrinis albus DSM 14484]